MVASVPIAGTAVGASKLARKAAKALKKSRAPAPNEGDKIIFRMGTSKESPTRFGRKAQEAEDKIGLHGVSGSTIRPRVSCSSALCSSLERAGFKVVPIPTRRDPGHVTIKLPKPVTKKIAKKFNDAFGR